jgi:integrase
VFKRHRKRGEGTIIERTRTFEDGTKKPFYEVRVSIGFDAKGKRRRKSFSADTIAKALEKRNTWLAAHPGARAFTEPTNLLVRDYLTSWIERNALSKKPKTIEHYRSIVEQHLCPELGAAKAKDERKRVLSQRTSIGHLRLAKLTPLHISHLLLDIEKAPKFNGGAKSSRLVALCFKVLNTALNQAVREKEIEVNPAAEIPRPKTETAEIEFLNEEDARTFLEAAKSDSLYPLFVLALGTGMRRGELLGLRKNDFDANCSLVQVRRQIGLVNGQLVESDVKTKAGKRRIDLPAHVSAVLREHLKTVKGKWVFSDENGQPLNPTAMVRNHYDKILKAANLPHLSFHSLRHTSATICLLKGVSPKVVQERLGHSKIEITLEVYSHVLPSLQVDAAARLDEALFPG